LCERGLGEAACMAKACEIAREVGGDPSRLIHSNDPLPRDWTSACICSFRFYPWKDRRIVQMNRRILITGGTSGLGLALVRELSARGARVAFVARHREDVERVAREHPGTVGIVGDVSRKDDIYPIATEVIGNLGGLDVLVNNASSLGPVPLALLGDTE